MKSLLVSLPISLALLIAYNAEASTQSVTALSTDTGQEMPAVAGPAKSPASAADPSSASDIVAPQLQSDLRALWRGHIDATRDYALAVEAGSSAEAKAAAAQVVTNAKAISSAVAGFYGDAGGEEMLQLLSGHWGAVKAMTDSAKKGDHKAAEKALADAIANAGEIARFLAGANPNLPEDTVNGLMVTHVEHHRTQIHQIMSGDTAGEAETWKAMQAHMDMISDALAAAIAKQFPDKAA